MSSKIESNGTQLRAEAPGPLLPSEKKRVLLADDSPQILESLGKVLRMAGFDVELADDGGQAIVSALEGSFDAVLLDLNMPGMNGWETLEHLANLRPRLPVIVITAQPDQREWAEANHAAALMEKPLDLPMLLRTLRESMTRSPVRLEPDRKEGRAGRRISTAPTKQVFRSPV